MRKQTSILLVLIGLFFLAGCGGNTPAPATLNITEFPTGGSPIEMTVGPDGTLWFTEGIEKVGRITPAG